MSSENRPAPSKHKFQKTKRLLDDFFKVDEYVGSYEQYDNTFSPEHKLLVFERGDSVAALLYDPTHREVILVEQFRLPTVVGHGVGGGWILEPAAGIIEEGETARDAIISEVLEETGYAVTDIAPVMTFFVSPGGSTERIHMFYAEVRRSQKQADGGGVKKDREDIRIVQMPIVDFFERLRKNEFEDAKLIIAAQWLRDRQATMSFDHTSDYRPELRQVRLPNSGRGKKFVGYMTGNILGVKGVDVWVNPLNTDMMLDRFGDRTVSAHIRTAGADKYPGSRRIRRDTIGEELQRAMGRRNFVKPAKVIETSSGRLEASNNVKRIFHVATTRGEIGEDVGSGLQMLESCIDNVLTAVEGRRRYTSIVFPMLGTGEGGMSVNEVARPLLARAIEFFKTNPGARLEKIFFLPYSVVDAETVLDALQALDHEFEPEPDAPLTPAPRSRSMV